MGKKMGTVEPVYETKNGRIADDKLAFVYGAIEKYGADKELCEQLYKYIGNIVVPFGMAMRVKPSPFDPDGWCVLLEKEENLKYRGEMFTIKVKFWKDMNTGHEFTDSDCGDFMWDLFRAYCEAHYDSFTEIFPEMKKEEENASIK